MATNQTPLKTDSSSDRGGATVPEMLRLVLGLVGGVAIGVVFLQFTIGRFDLTAAGSYEEMNRTWAINRQLNNVIFFSPSAAGLLLGIIAVIRRLPLSFRGLALGLFFSPYLTYAGWILFMMTHGCKTLPLSAASSTG
jgi:hypothetical protein